MQFLAKARAQETWKHNPNCQKLQKLDWNSWTDHIKQYMRKHVSYHIQPEMSDVADLTDIDTLTKEMFYSE